MVDSALAAAFYGASPPFTGAGINPICGPPGAGFSTMPPLFTAAPRPPPGPPPGFAFPGRGAFLPACYAAGASIGGPWASLTASVAEARVRALRLAEAIRAPDGTAFTGKSGAVSNTAAGSSAEQPALALALQPPLQKSGGEGKDEGGGLPLRAQGHETQGKVKTGRISRWDMAEKRDPTAVLSEVDPTGAKASRRSRWDISGLS